MRGKHGRSAARPSAGQIAGDMFLMAFQCADANLVELGVAQKTLDFVLRSVAVTAENLHRVVGDLLGRRSDGELYGVGPQTIAEERNLKQPRQVSEEVADNGPLCQVGFRPSARRNTAATADSRITVDQCRCPANSSFLRWSDPRWCVRVHSRRRSPTCLGVGSCARCSVLAVMGAVVVFGRVA